MAQRYKSRYVDLRGAVMLIAERASPVGADRDTLLIVERNARDQLIAALRDGAIEAQGQLSVVADDPRAARDWPGVEATVRTRHPSRPITIDWWIGVGLDVKVSFNANAMSRRTGNDFEIMRAIRIKLADLNSIWPQQRSTETAGGESVAIKALAEHLTANQGLTRADAAQWCKTAGYDLGLRPFDRVWQGARERAGLPRRAPPGRKSKSPR
jgi:hypothetical protein